MKEFKPLKGWSNYVICEDGNLYKDTKNGLVKVKTNPSKLGYHIVNLSDFSQTPRRRFTGYFQGLMMEHFGPPKPGPDYRITHIDGNKDNNAIDNLKWKFKNDIRRKKGIPTEVYNIETGETIIYPTLTSAARSLKTSTVILRKVINNERDIKMKTKLQYKIRIL